MARLDDDRRATFLAAHPEWMLEGETISRTFSFPDFVTAMGFVTSMAIAAEKAFHHPDIDIRYNRVTVSLTTHDEGGLTDKDAALAERLDDLA